jgi:hypothetical protein
MGSFYGSVQIKGADRNAIKSVVEKLASKQELRFLIGPDLGGWVGVYPADHGQDTRTGHAIARKLPGEVFHLLVHDDDFFVYEYYRDGKLVDRFNSRPDYFAPVSASEARKLRGRPETFAHLAPSGDVVALKSMLANPEAESFAFASTLLDRFAQALGIRNTLTSYEYLQNGEGEGLEEWDDFVHVPDLTSAKAQQRQLEESQRALKQDLIREGLLFAELGGKKGRDLPSPCWCPAPDGAGFLLGWSDHVAPRQQTMPLERYGPPWPAGPAPTPLAIDSHVFGMTLSPSGRYLAVAHAAAQWKAALWDLAENRRLLQVPQVPAVSSVGFSPDEKSMISVSSDGEDGRVVIAPVDGSEPRIIVHRHAKLAAMHPAGAKLVVVDNRAQLTVIDTATFKPERACWVGGLRAVGSIERGMRDQMRQAAANVDSDELERTMRKQWEQMLGHLTPKALPPGIGSIEAFKEQMEQQLNAQIRTMREEHAKIGTSEWEADRQSGSVIVFRMMFDPKGEWLCLGTSDGAWVYPWSDVATATENLPRPVLTVDAGSRYVETDHGPIEQGDYVYAIDHDPDRGRFLFGGLEGRVRFVDPRSGRSGVLLEPPGRWPINHLGLSLDRSAVALTIQPDSYSNALYKAGPVVQFWNYSALPKTDSA